MGYFPQSLNELVTTLTMFPGIGKKSAQRLAYYLLNCPQNEANRLLAAIQNARGKIKRCKTCYSLTETEVCTICSDGGRNRAILCVIETSHNLFVLEGSGVYKGLYHVLDGLISPLDGVGPEHLRISELIARVKKENIKEVILALSSNVEGEATATYIKQALASTDVTLSRIASGIPVGGELEYADEITLARSLEGRIKF